jgi:hypothetical protein
MYGLNVLLSAGFEVSFRQLRYMQVQMKYPGSIAKQHEPSLPSPAKAPPGGPDWIHEIKHDGFRIIRRWPCCQLSRSAPAARRWPPRPVGTAGYQTVNVYPVNL